MQSTAHDWIKQHISQKVTSALVNLAPSQDWSGISISGLLDTPPNIEMGDYALPCFAFAKTLRKSPAQIAELLRNELKVDAVIEKAEVVSGFLNIYCKISYLAETLIKKLEDESYFTLLSQENTKQRERVMVEYSNPNTHKEFHVGHVRNACLGDSICRIFTYLGHDVIPVNYIGDEGTHVAKCLWKTELNALPPNNIHASLWYGQKYFAANNALKEASGETKEQYEQEIRKILQQIEAKNGPFYELWLKSKEHCMQDFYKIYEWLDVHFAHYFYESEVSEGCQKIVDEWIKKGLFYESDGAIGRSLEEDGLGFFMARRRDGTSLYITKDLELARQKFDNFAIDRSIYVVGSEQNFHFRQLFRVLELMGFPNAKKCFHLSYAHVTLVGGKISSRAGNAFAFFSLVELMEEELGKVLQKYQGDWEQSEIAATTKKLALGAIKYAMLHADPGKEITFDPDVWTSFEGNTGPYLLYSYSRSCSILHKIENYGWSNDGASIFTELKQKEEKELLRQIYEFNNTVSCAAAQYKPSIIGNYLFDLCKGFNRFYANASVLHAETDDLKKARAFLVMSFSKVLKKGLHLIGITPPERM